MRLGKTVTLTHWFNWVEKKLKRKLKILIIAPKTPLVSWRDEIPPSRSIAGPRKARNEVIRKAHGYFLITPQSAVKTPTLVQTGWDIVVCDESTFLKSAKSQAFKKLTRWFKHTPYKAILTGLPNPQDNMELWPQMAWLHGGEWLGYNNYWKARQGLCRRAGFNWVLHKRGNERIEAAVAEQGYSLTREQAGVGNPKLRLKIYGDFDENTKQLFAQAVKRWEIPGLWSKNSIVTAGWLHRMCGGFLPSRQLPCWKYQRLLRLLRTTLRGSQVVVWFAYNRELKRAYQVLRNGGFKVGWITGKILSLEERQRRVDKFRAGGYQIILLQQKCGRFGLNLSTSNIEIFFSNWWSHETRKQCEDRIEDTGKNRANVIIDLITRNSPDEDVLDTLQDHTARTSDYTDAIRRRRYGVSADS